MSAYRYARVAAAIGHTERLHKPTVQKAIAAVQRNTITTRMNRQVAAAASKTKGKR